MCPKLRPHPLPPILQSLTPNGVDAQLDIARVATALAFRRDPSPEYSGTWLLDIQRGVEILADLCGKVGRRCKDWDPLQAQATSVNGDPVGWFSDDGKDLLDLVVGVDIDVREERARYSENDLDRLVQAKEGIESLLPTTLPMNDYSNWDWFYSEFGPALVLDVLALPSVVDFDLSSDPASGSGKFHHWCVQVFTVGE